MNTTITPSPSVNNVEDRILPYVSIALSTFCVILVVGLKLITLFKRNKKSITVTQSSGEDNKVFTIDIVDGPIAPSSSPSSTYTPYDDQWFNMNPYVNNDGLPCTPL